MGGRRTPRREFFRTQARKPFEPYRRFLQIHQIGEPSGFRNPSPGETLRSAIASEFRRRVSGRNRFRGRIARFRRRGRPRFPRPSRRARRRTGIGRRRIRALRRPPQCRPPSRALRAGRPHGTTAQRHPRFGALGRVRFLSRAVFHIAFVRAQGHSPHRRVGRARARVRPAYRPRTQETPSRWRRATYSWLSPSKKAPGTIWNRPSPKSA